LTQKPYPKFQLRLQAVIIDAVIMFVLFLFSGLFIARFDLPSYAKISFVALVIVAFEPGLVSLTGSTIGHAIRNLKVEDSSSGRRLGFPRALLRFIIKATLGLYSLVSLLVTRRHQAVHDMAVRSVVVLRHPERYSEDDRIPERADEDEAHVYPSRIRRAIITLVYAILYFVGYVLLLYFFLSDSCFLYDACSSLEQFVEFVLSIAWIAGFLGLIYLGANGRLWAARKTLRSPRAD
jgi:uncharacterized RDD family membrane protein YckC